MKRYLLAFLIAFGIFSLPSFGRGGGGRWPAGYVRVEGMNLVEANGQQLKIRGTNFGNWLNPEGYMFGFRKVNSPRFINEMLCQLVGPAEWDSIVNFAEADRSSYELIRKARPSQALSRRLLREYLDNLAPSRCNIQHSYLHSIGLEPKKK